MGKQWSFVSTAKVILDGVETECNDKEVGMNEQFSEL